MQTAISSLVSSYAFRPIAVGPVIVKVGAVINKEEVKTPFFIGETWVTNGLVREFRRACAGSPVSAFLSLPCGDNVCLGDVRELDILRHLASPVPMEDLLKRMIGQWEQNASQGVCEVFRTTRVDGFGRRVPFAGILRLLKECNRRGDGWEKLAPMEFWKSLEIRKVVPASENFKVGEEGQPASIRDYFTAWRVSRWLVSEQVRAGLLPENMVGRLPRLREDFVARVSDEDGAKVSCPHYHQLLSWPVVTGPDAVPDWMTRGFRAVAVQE